MELRDGDLHIWRYTLNVQDHRDEKNNQVLSKEEKERSKRFIQESDRIRYCCNRRFVRQILSKYLNSSPAEIDIAYHKDGKPYLIHSDLCFNYSYRNNYCLLGVSKSEIGIDIEFMKALKDPPTFISFCFAEKEKEIISKSSAENYLETLFTFWTFKEAIIKSIGIGLNTDISQIDLSDFLNSESNPIAYDTNEVYTIRKLKAPEGYKAAFAIKGGLNELIEFNHNRD